MARDAARLSRHDVETLNTLLEVIHKMGGFGKIQLVIEGNQVTQHEISYSTRHHVQVGSPDALGELAS